MSSKRFISGFHAVQAALTLSPTPVKRLWFNKNRKDKRVVSVVATAQSLGVEVIEASNQILADLTSTTSKGQRQQAVVALTEESLATCLNLKAANLVLGLNGITDVHNVGACLRVASAVGVDVVISDVAPNPNARDIIGKTSSGASLTIPQVHVNNLIGTLRTLKAIGHTIVGSSCWASTSIFDVKLKAPLVLVVGSEGNGLSSAVKKECDVLIKIPMIGKTPSLNVSVACGVMLFEIRKQLFW